MSPIVALLIASTATSPTLPTDIWSGHYGGLPALSLLARDGAPTITVTLPARVIDGADSAQLAGLIQTFVQRYGPGMCSDIFDFNKPRAGMHVEFALQDLDQSGPGFRFYTTSEHTATVTFDYTPEKPVTCVTPEPPTS